MFIIVYLKLFNSHKLKYSINGGFEQKQAYIYFIQIINLTINL